MVELGAEAQSVTTDEKDPASCHTDVLQYGAIKLNPST